MPKLARELIVTTDGVEKAVKNLAQREADGDCAGLIETRKIGEVVWARIRVEAFDEIEEREPETLSKSEPRQEEEPERKGGYRPFAPGSSQRFEGIRAAVIENDKQSEALGLIAETVDGELLIRINSRIEQECSTESIGCAERRTQVTEIQNGHKRKMDELLEEESKETMRDFLARWCVNSGPRLGPPTDQTIKNALDAQGDMPYDNIARRLKQESDRIRRAEKPWGIVVWLIREERKAFEGMVGHKKRSSAEDEEKDRVMREYYGGSA